MFSWDTRLQRARLEGRRENRRRAGCAAGFRGHEFHADGDLQLWARHCWQFGVGSREPGSKSGGQTKETASGRANCISGEQSTEINHIEDIVQVLPVSLKPHMELL